MPQTYRDYSIKELALSLFYRPRLASDSVEIARGDIIDVREPYRGVGTKEMHVFLWLRVYGLDREKMYRLVEQLPGPGGAGTLPIYEKRRYCIPLARLKQVYPAFDIALARDPNVVYQPFLLTDAESGRYAAQAAAALPVQGLVYDKATRRYL